MSTLVLKLKTTDFAKAIEDDETNQFFFLGGGFERFKTVINPTPTPILTLDIYNLIIWCHFKPKQEPTVRMAATRFSHFFPLASNIYQLCLLIGLSHVGFVFCYLPTWFRVNCL